MSGEERVSVARHALLFESRLNDSTTFQPHGLWLYRYMRGRCESARMTSGGRFRRFVRSRNQAMRKPAAKPPTCAHQATPPDSWAVIENAPWKNCIANQMTRNTGAGITMI